MLRLFGWNLGSNLGREFEFDGSSLSNDQRQAVLQIPGIENALTLPVGDGVESIEKEPNDSASEATRLDLPFAVTGCIDQAGDQDRFAFAARKGEKLLLQVQSASLGFALDAWLKIEDLKGKELAKSDDSGTPTLSWNGPRGKTARSSRRWATSCIEGGRTIFIG